MPELPYPLHPSPLAGGAVLYLTIGLGRLAAVGIEPPRCWTRAEPDSAPSVGSVAVAAAVAAVHVLLWPLAFLLRGIGRLRVHRGETLRTPWGMRAHERDADAARSLTQVGPDMHPRAQPEREGSVTREPRPLLRSQESTAYRLGASACKVVRAVEERRLLDAVFAAQALVWDVEREYGPSSAHLWNATELLAHVCHVIGDDRRAVQLYLRATGGWAHSFGIDHPAARAAFGRAHALWAATAAADDRATGVLIASWSRLLGPRAALRSAN